MVGAPRSGTTLLRSMLDAHPRICCPTWETGIFDRFAEILRGDLNKPHGDEPNFAFQDRRVLLSWMRRSCDDLMRVLTEPAGKPRWCEKTPSHVFCVDIIHEVYPEAQFIHIIRNGSHVVRSLQNVAWSPRRIRWSVDRWRDSVEAGRRFGSKLSSALYREIRYEELCDQPEASIRGLCDFLQETFTPQMLEFHKPENNSWGIAQGAIDAARPRAYRELNFAERTLLRLRAGQLLGELGYR